MDYVYEFIVRNGWLGLLTVVITIIGIFVIFDITIGKLVDKVIKKYIGL